MKKKKKEKEKEREEKRRVYCTTIIKDNGFEDEEIGRPLIWPRIAISLFTMRNGVTHYQNETHQFQ
jgi:hypothetical protein